MIVIVAGSRTITDYAIVKATIEASGFNITELVSGHAPPSEKSNWLPSVDLLGERWAEENGITPRKFPAAWKRYGKPAGVIRNGWMSAYASENCPDGGGLVAAMEVDAKGKTSTGTADMVVQATKRGLATFVQMFQRTDAGELLLVKTTRYAGNRISSVGWLDLGVTK